MKVEEFTYITDNGGFFENTRRIYYLDNIEEIEKVVSEIYRKKDFYRSDLKEDLKKYGYGLISEYDFCKYKKIRCTVFLNGVESKTKTKMIENLNHFKSLRISDIKTEEK